MRRRWSLLLLSLAGLSMLWLRRQVGVEAPARERPGDVLREEPPSMVPAASHDMVEEGPPAVGEEAWRNTPSVPGQIINIGGSVERVDGYGPQGNLLVNSGGLSQHLGLTIFATIESGWGTRARPASEEAVRCWDRFGKYPMYRCEVRDDGEVVVRFSHYREWLPVY